MGEAERRKEAHETGRTGGNSPGGLSGPLESQGVVTGRSALKDPSGPDSARLGRGKSAVREYAEAILIAILLALFIRTFIVQAFKIPSGSMIPTLFVGDHILVNKFLFGTRIPFTDLKLIPFRDPRRLDIIVFKYPEDETKDFIKRIIGEPGDRVEILDKIVYVNGHALSETYAIHKDPSVFPLDLQPRDNFGPIVVPEDSYFVMGDNRDQSLDSRFWGFVNNSQVRGKAFMIYWSWDGKDTWIRWNRIGHLVS